MSGRLTYSPAGPHDCEGLPDPTLLRPMAQWQCDDCGTTWIILPPPPPWDGWDGELIPNEWTRWNISTEPVKAHGPRFGRLWSR